MIKISSFLLSGLNKKYSDIIGIIFISICIMLASIYIYTNKKDLFFGKSNIETFYEIQDKKAVKKNNINNVNNIVPINTTEVKRYLTVAFYEELLKLLVAIIIFYIYIFSGKKFLNNLDYKYIFIGALFISSFSFFMIENIMYVEGGIPLISIFFRLINPVHFFMVIIIIESINSRIDFNKKLILNSFIISILLHFLYNFSIIMNYNFIVLSIIFIGLTVLLHSLIEYENNIIQSN